MKIRLLRGVEFWAIPRPDDTIDIYWGRPGLRAKKTKYKDCPNVRYTLNLVGSCLRKILNEKIPQVDKAKAIKDEKEVLLERLQGFEVKNERLKKIKAIELFGGIGASTQALKRQFGKENINIVDFVELDKNAVASYNAINGTSFVPTDINNVDMKAYPEVDLIIAGWPCQDYSIAGKGLGLEGTRSSLILLTIAKIKEMENKPKHILLENVKGLLSKSHKEDLEWIKALFDELGYNWDQALLNSKYFDIPQSRERVFMFLTRKDLKQKYINKLENRKNINKKLKDVLDFSETTKQIKISKLLENKNVIIKNGQPVFMLSDKSTRSLFKIKGENKTINIPHTSNYTNSVMGTKDGQSPTIMAGSPRYIYIKNEMTNYNGKIIEIDIWKLFNQEKNDINKIATLGTVENQNFIDHSFNQKKHFLGIEGNSKTLRAGDCDNENKIMYCFDTSIIHYRKISTLECWRLMGFTDENHNALKALTYFTKNGKEKRLISDSQLAKQAGNSIVVNVLEAIFKETLKGGQ